MNRKIIVFLAIFTVIAVSFTFGFQRLSEFSAVDEPYWTYGRTSKFWNAIKAHKWKSTNINDKPGITVAIISGVGLFSTDPMRYSDIRDDQKDATTAEIFKKINFSFRFPIFIFTLLMLPLFYLLLKKIFNEAIALFSLIFIGLSPIILGISLIINPDSLLWIFLPLSLLSFLVFQKEGKKKYLYAAGFFLGLSLLTKYVANILYVYFFGLIFLEYIFGNEKNKEIMPYLKKSLLDYAIIVAVSMLTFFILFPATWENPKLLLEGTFLSKAFKSAWPLFASLFGIILVDMVLMQGKIISTSLNFIGKYKKSIIKIAGWIIIAIIIFTVLNTWLGMEIFNFETTLASPKSGDDSSFSPGIFAENFFADFYALIFGLTPIVFLFLIFSLVKNATLKKEFGRENVVVFYFSLFIILYYLASTFNHVGATVRYQIILYPLASIMAAIGLCRFIMSEKFKKYLHNSIIYFVLIILSSVSLFLIKPFYFSYASSLLPSKYVLNLKDMGDGSYEAAQYLNTLPNANNLYIWSDKGAVCETFVGKCKTGLSQKDWKTRFDYLIVSSGRKSRSLKLSGGLNKMVDFKQLYSADPSTHKIIIGSRPNNFVKIVSAEDAYKK